MVGRRPVAMAIEQRPDNSAVQNSRKRFVLLFRFPFRYHFIAFRETADAQSVSIRRAATPARVLRRVLFLKRFLTHGGSSAPRSVLRWRRSRINKNIALGERDPRSSDFARNFPVPIASTFNCRSCGC